MAAYTVDTGYGVRTEEGTGWFDDPGRTGVVSLAVFFDAGGLIHAAVGLAGGTGGFLTKRSGFFWNT